MYSQPHQYASPPPLVHPVPMHATGPVPLGRLSPQQQQQQFHQNAYQQQQYAQPNYPSAYASQQQYQQNNAPLQGLMNDPTAQLSMQLGSKAMQVGQEYINENLNRYVSIPHIRYYFKVSNAYVFRKLRLVMFPFRHKSWHRLAKHGEQGGQTDVYKTPRDDLNAPDLYIPAMAFATYVLLIGYEMKEKFHPKFLGMTSSTAIFIVFCEILFIKLGCYFFNILSPVPILDLLAYTGYKFIGIIVTLLARFYLPDWAMRSVWIYTSLSTGFFLLRSMRYIVIPELGTSTVQVETRRRRINFLLAIAGVQFAFSWLLVRKIKV